MFRNYLITALRSFSKSLAHVSTNVIGLGIGIGMCIMTFLLTAFNSEFNKYYDKDITDEIYRLEYSNIENDKKAYYGSLELAYSEFLDKDIPGIESVLRFYSRQASVKTEKDRFGENLSFCNNAFLEALSFDLLEGSYAELNEPVALYISEEIADKYFGDESPIGKAMQIDVKDSRGGIQDYIVKGVFKDGKSNASFGYVDMFTNFENIYRVNQLDRMSETTGIAATTFIRVENNETLKNTAMLAKLEETALRMDEDGDVKMRFTPFSEIHKTPGDRQNQVQNGFDNTDIPDNILLTFNLMSLLILLIACFNYTIYAFSFAGKRLKEIGVRKVSGGNRKQIMLQFLSESLLLSFISLLVGLLFAQIIIPVFESFFNGFPYELSDVDPLRLIFYLAGITLLMAFVAGFYPALYVSKFNPSAILAKNAKLKKTGWVTYSLVLVQQLITIVGLGASFIFTNNIHWQENMDFGYDKDNLLTIQGLNATDKGDVFVEFVKEHPKVVSTGISWKMLGNGTGDRKIILQGKEYYIDLMEFGPNYLETNKVRLAKGRFWDSESETDMTASCLVNKKFLETTNLENPLNEKITLPDGQIVKIIGVVENYKHVGCFEKIQPTVINYPLEKQFKFLAIRGKNMEDLKEIDEYCKEKWESLEPFIAYRSMYDSGAISGGVRSSISFKKTFLLTAIIALVLSIGGMYSLITILLQKRKKEIAIRKSIGSSVQSLLFIVSKPYVIVSFIAGIIGSVVGIQMISGLLDNMYAYHVKVRLIWYVLAAVLMLLITLVTISTQTYRAATANPVKGLRYE